VVFVGTGFPERVEILTGVDWTGIDIGIYGTWPTIKPSSPLAPLINDAVVPNARTAALYRRAKIGLNLFRQTMGWGEHAPRIQGAESLGPRSYELAEVVEQFGDLVPTFRTARELEDLVRRWLADDAGRASIAARLPESVREHSWTERAGEMLQHLATSTRRDAAPA
jgi:hypothetical protein